MVDRRLEPQIERAIECEMGKGHRAAAKVIDLVSDRFGIYRQDVRFTMNMLDLQVDRDGLIIDGPDRSH